MTDQSRSERSIFESAIEKSPAAARAAFLDEACAGDHMLRADVEALLAAHDQLPRLQDAEPAPNLAATVEDPITEGPGTVIGPYKLMEQIGEGGMGLVFVAEQQEPVRRRVALKIIKPGMDSRQVIARFEAERQALAMMDHQNIARVFDAGTTASGRPYFVMELVHGVPIIAYCDANQLTPRERLKLFVPVCQAIQHAHQKGIIHRDIKPSNILVTMYDDKAVPKVIDFGVAKAIEQRLTEKTVYTQFGTLVGTFEYMSPEQAEMNAFGVDTRSDIYSLGVLLYELLTGTTPLERPRLRDAAFVEIVRMIKEEEPPRPSVRLSTSGALAKVAAARKTDPAKLSKLVRGELDWVVMKCLEKNRTRRYESASSLARDVERYLEDKPVEAGPPSTWYRFSKLARRNKAALTTAAVVAAALILGTAVSIWQAIRASQAERVARLNEKDALDAKEQAVQRSDELRRENYVADMNMAQHAWDSNNLARFRELLDRHRPKPGETDLRGFEWYYLHRQLHQDLLTVKAHVGDARMVAYTVDGKKLFSFGTSQPPEAGKYIENLPSELKLWDAATGRQLTLSLKGPTDKVTCATLSPDGKYLAAGCRDKIVRVWDLGTGELIPLQGHTYGSSVHIGFSHDGKRVISLANKIKEDGREIGSEIKVWDIATHEAIASFDKLPASLSCALSPDGKLAAASGIGSAIVRLWDVTSGRELPSLGDAGRWGGVVAFSPDGKRLAFGGMRGVNIWDVATGKSLATYRGASEFILGAAFSPDGKRLATASPLGLVELWDTATGQKVRTIKGHAGGVWSVAFSPDGEHLASAGSDGALKVWDTKGDSDPITIPVSRGDWFSLLSPDGQTVLTGIADNTIRLWDAATGQPRDITIRCPHRIRGFDVRPDWKRMAVLDAGNKVTIWDLETGKAVRTVPNVAEGASDVAISPDGKLLALLLKGGTIKLWDLDKSVEFPAIQAFEDDLYGVNFSPDGARLLGVSSSGTLKLFDAATGRELLTKRLGDFGIQSIRWSPDGKRLAVAGYASRYRTGEIQILELDSGRQITPPLKGHSALVRMVAFSPDGQRLAGGGIDKTVKIWDLTTGQEILTLKGNTDMITCVHFLSDGCRLMSVAMDGTVRVWDATPVPEDD
jgi:WD40 repeat protein/serine/threonine protein kinase